MKKNKNLKIEHYSNMSNLSFYEQIDLLMNNEWNINSSLIIFKNTPKLYINLGLTNRHITVSSAKMKSIIKGNKNHVGIGVKNVKSIPKAITNPLIILEFITKENCIVVITELLDKFNNIIIVAIQIDGYGNIEFVDSYKNKIIKTKITNAVLSAYGKNNFNSWIHNHNKLIIYSKNDEIIKKRINGKWVQSPNAINSSTNNNTINS